MTEEKIKRIHLVVSERLHSELRKKFPQSLSKKMREYLKDLLINEDESFKKFCCCCKCGYKYKCKVEELIVSGHAYDEKDKSFVYWIICPLCKDNILLKGIEYWSESIKKNCDDFGILYTFLIEEGHSHQKIIKEIFKLLKYFPNNWESNEGRLFGKNMTREDLISQYEAIIEYENKL
jgi:hypothetical protein